MMTDEHVHFVTGRLAEHALRATLARLAPQIGFQYSVGVLPITVAALMTPQWIARHIAPPQQATRVLVPGYCQGDLEPVRARVGRPVERGPKDLRMLPEYYGRRHAKPPDYGAYDIEILAEINHAPQLSLAEIRQQAQCLAADGADVIDVGCQPGDPWTGVADCVRALRDDGHRVSVDSLNPAEIEPAVRAGAELVLSVNASNRDAARDWGCEVVVVPDQPNATDSLHQTVRFLQRADVPFRIDPILEPIGCGLADSIARFIDVRGRYPGADMLMGIGNLTELTDVDSAGVNVLLLGLCQELGVRSVLTTQVINWAQTSVRECDLARRLVRYAVAHGVPPKHLEPQLVVLRDAGVCALEEAELERLAGRIRDRSYRVVAGNGRLHLVGAGLHLAAADPFVLFDRFMAASPRNVDASHAFYLGYEMAKAAIALALGKEYRQDDPLDWGYLTADQPRRGVPGRSPDRPS